VSRRCVSRFVESCLVEPSHVMSSRVLGTPSGVQFFRTVWSRHVPSSRCRSSRGKSCRVSSCPGLPPLRWRKHFPSVQSGQVGACRVLLCHVVSGLCESSHGSHLRVAHFFVIVSPLLICVSLDPLGFAFLLLAIVLAIQTTTPTDLIIRPLLAGDVRSR
jgi:hypothetical protein